MFIQAALAASKRPQSSLKSFHQILLISNLRVYLLAFYTISCQLPIMVNIRMIYEQLISKQTPN